MFQLGVPVTDAATDLKGMLTILHVDMDRSRVYCFQPKGLNPDTGEPVEPLWMAPNRVKGGVLVPQPDIPYSILGTEVTDRASGFTGTAISLILHTTGCFHVNVQPGEKIKKTGSVGKACNFDIRRLEGPALRKLSQAEVKQDKKDRPSPVSYTNPAPTLGKTQSSPRP